MDTEVYKLAPVDEQTRQETAHYTLKAAYALVQDDLRKLVIARDRFGGDNSRLHIAIHVVAQKLDSMATAPNE